MAYLVVKVDSQEVCRQELKKDETVTIGRALDCTLWLANPKLSRTHCKIVPDAGKWLLVDPGSRNGTYVDGDRIDKHVLSDGDTFELDNASITYRDGPFVPPRPANPSADKGPSVPKDLLEGAGPKTDPSAESSLYATRAVAKTKPTMRAQAPAPNLVKETRPGISHGDSTLVGHKPLAFTRPPAKPKVESQEQSVTVNSPRDVARWLIVGGLAAALVLMAFLLWIVF
jgi:predicted component of type VI protein secretion system